MLSGADADGSLGLREIKHAGGFTFAQQPESARFPTMPRHAIETGCVDLVLRPKEIAGELARLSRRFRSAEPGAESNSEVTLDVGTDDESAVLARIFQRLRSAHGVDFTHYKRTTIRRRIERRMMLRRIESLEEYPRIARSRSRRARRAVPGLPDQGHRVLSRSGRLRGAASARASRAL